ncbi:LacI family DNA-binding transcriptional regulator [Flavobacterium sp.]
MKSKATLKQIAKELGVSVSTVSKALNGSPEISESTKQRVQEYAKLKNYKPNVIGLNLKNRSTKTIGVILPNILNSFFAKVFSGIEKIADERGYKLITCISNESYQKEINAIEMLSNGTIDGFIISISDETQQLQNFDHLKEMLIEGIPLVLFDRNTEEINCDKVMVDDFESAVNAIEYLLKTGSKKIALLSSIDNLSVGKLRTQGFYQALKNHNLQSDENLVILSNTNEEFNLKIDDFFIKNKPDAIFAIDEHASVTSMKIIIKNGYKIPDDIQIIGFADGLWSRRMTPSISTVSQHAPEVGKVAATLLIDRLENKDENAPFVTKVIKTELRKRDSTKKIL